MTISAKWNLENADKVKGVCVECGERATYIAPDMEASRGKEWYVISKYCDIHGPLPYILPERPRPPQAYTDWCAWRDGV